MSQKNFLSFQLTWMKRVLHEAITTEFRYPRAFSRSEIKATRGGADGVRKKRTASEMHLGWVQCMLHLQVQQNSAAGDHVHATGRTMAHHMDLRNNDFVSGHQNSMRRQQETDSATVKCKGGYLDLLCASLVQCFIMRINESAG